MIHLAPGPPLLFPVTILLVPPSLNRLFYLLGFASLQNLSTENTRNDVLWGRKEAEKKHLAANLHASDELGACGAPSRLGLASS